MKERPILMTPENAQKCFDGVKTQTRRVVKLDVGQWEDIGLFMAENPCPYGVAGDRLWIREAWAAYSGGVSIECEECDLIEGPIDINEISPPTLVYKGAGYSSPERWRSAMHMYRWACRTVVEITEIRVQRVQEISDDDKIAEGMDINTCLRGRTDQWVALWNSINGADSWGHNPWVWALTFRKVQP